LLVDVWKTIYIWWWEFWRASRLEKKKQLYVAIHGNGYRWWSYAWS
jgi:hypothetical protein